jgi:hypothetical protein
MRAGSAASAHVVAAPCPRDSDWDNVAGAAINAGPSSGLAQALETFGGTPAHVQPGGSPVAIDWAHDGQAIGAPTLIRGRRLAPAAFVAAATVSEYGDFLTTVALMVALFQFTGSAAAPAGYMVARLVPRVLGPMPGGRLADRTSPATVLVTV